VWWVGYVRGSRGWRSHPPTADSMGGLAKGEPEPGGTSPSLSVESPSPTGRPPLVAGPGVTERRDGPPSGRPHLRPHRRCRQRLACTSCRVVEVPHHHVLLLLRLMRRLGHGQGSCQLCTTDLVDGAAQQVVQLKL
jgi:hypothetical protein